MLDDDDGMSTFDEGIKSTEQTTDIVEMESGSRFIKDKEGRVGVFLTNELGQFNTLVLTTREGRGTLTEFDISQSDIL